MDDDDDDDENEAKLRVAEHRYWGTDKKIRTSCTYDTLGFDILSAICPSLRLKKATEWKARLASRLNATEQNIIPTCTQKLWLLYDAILDSRGTDGSFAYSE